MIVIRTQIWPERHERHESLKRLLTIMLTFAAIPLMAATIQSWPPGGIYTNYVGIVFSVSDGSIRYTLDGSEPRLTNPSAFGPLLIKQNTVVKAKAFRREEPISPMIEARYEIVKTDVWRFRSTLPLILLNTLGRTPTKTNRVASILTAIGVTNGESSLGGPVEYSGDATVGVRGNSTRHKAKRPYRIELQDDKGADRKVALLGMPPESDWILLASYNDKTFVRDPLAHELWRQLGNYAPRWRYVELFLVETNDPAAPPLSMANYEGIYILIEKIKRGKNRVQIDKLRSEPAELETPGGYILKRDRLGAGERGFISVKRIDFAFEDPKERDLTSQQKEWITNDIRHFETVLFGDGFTDPRRGYPSMIDVQSFIDYHWIIELSMNADGYGYSVFLHKDRAGKLRMGPVWDWDLTFANVTFLGNDRPDGWQWERFSQYPFYKWYERMFEDPDFLQRYIDRWQELRGGVFSTTNVLGLVDQCLAKLSPEAITRNYQRWPTMSPFLHANKIVGTNYEAHVRWLRNWIVRRLQWIDGECFPAPLVQSSVPVLGGGRRVRLEAPIGEIFFTTDGSDPRASGGGVSEKARRFEGEINLGEESLFARTRSPFKLWSPPLILTRDP